ncbi:MAG: hypothetical protein U0R28_06255 [Candidatus Nanopelagicales bacterium]
MKLAELLVKHSDTIAAGIDKAAATAKDKQPAKASYIDKAAAYAKKTMDQQKR